jgi:hypothetical protein
MRGYDLDLLCRPSGDFRIPEIVDFLYLVREAFQIPVLYGSDNKIVEISEENLERRFEKEAKKLLPGVGVNMGLFSIPPRERDIDTIFVLIHSGSDPDGPIIDSFSVSVNKKKLLPDLDYLGKFIKIFKPFEAFLSDRENEIQLNSYERERAIGGFTKPAIIRGLHYLDKDMAMSIGGINYCLKAPAWHVDRFCEGVLIDLVPGVFDSSNPEHLGAQQDVMAYFDML